MCQFKGTSAGQARLAGKSTNHVDGVGLFTGMTIVTRNTSKLKPATEKDAWAAGQKSAVRMLNFFRRKAEEGDKEAARRIDDTIAVIVGYSEYTQVMAEDP